MFEGVRDIRVLVSSIQLSQNYQLQKKPFKDQTGPGNLVKEILDQIVMLLKKEFEKGKIKLELNVEPENMIVDVDKELMEQVLINLIKNAIQALVEDEVKKKSKTIDLSAKQNDKNETTIVIKDNGPGIEEEALSKIFIPFFTTKKQGSGIGLSLSKQIIRKHNGTITVKSTINEGAEFTIKV